jgi:spermidine synthase
MLEPAKAPRWLLLSISLVSASAIAYEILLMRLLSIVQWHHFAYMIISLALLGYGLSGTALALARRWLERHFAGAYVASAAAFGGSMLVCFAVGQRVPFNALEIVWDPHQFLYLLLIYLLFFLPFFFAASCIGLALLRYKGLINRVYRADLIGAGSGAVLLIASLFLVRPEVSLQLMAVLALLAAALASLERTLLLQRRLVLVLLAVAVAVLLIPRSWLELQMSPYKGLRQTLQVMGTQVLSEHSGPLGLLTVVSSPGVPLRHAPGISLKSEHEPPPQLGMYTDGDALSVITRDTGERAALAYLDDLTTALPYKLLRQPRVLVLGAGTGADVLQAHYHRARSIDAVELNPTVIALMRGNYADYSGDLYDAKDVRVHVAEARGFVAGSRKRFDLIQVALLDSFTAASAGVQALSESYLYTVEALQEYLRHLAPGGMLAITRWLKLPPRDNLKLFATAVDALRGMGVDAPGERLALTRSWQTATLVIKNGALTPDEIEILKNFCRTRSFDVAYYPGMPATEANRFNVLPQAYLYDGAIALLGEQRTEFVRRYKFYIEPATDDRPYFFRFFKWQALEELMALRQRGGASLIEWGYLILLATLAQALVAGFLLILCPLSVMHGSLQQGARVVARLSLYFAALGLAFIFIEIAFIQKLVLFLSHPLYAVGVVLSGFLVFAGFGSGYSQRFAERLQDAGLSAIAVAVAVIAAIALVYLALLPVLARELIALADPLRVALSLALIAPLAFFMGMPFPLALARVSTHAPAFIPWAWGVNGFASVVSATLATLLAIHFGFTLVVAFALALYAFAVFILPRWS